MRSALTFVAMAVAVGIVGTLACAAVMKLSSGEYRIGLSAAIGGIGAIAGYVANQWRGASAQASEG